MKCKSLSILIVVNLVKLLKQNIQKYLSCIILNFKSIKAFLYCIFLGFLRIKFPGLLNNILKNKRYELDIT